MDIRTPAQSAVATTGFDVVEETRAFAEQLMSQMAAAQTPLYEASDPAAAVAAAGWRCHRRFASRAGTGPRLRVNSPVGPAKVRILMPETVRGVYLHLHGGGHVLSSAAASDKALWTLARNTGMVTVSVDYRLAPEHPFPAAPDDAERAALWLIQNAQSEFGTRRLIVGGESAGAHLAVVTLLRLRDRHQV